MNVNETAHFHLHHFLRQAVQSGRTTVVLAKLSGVTAGRGDTSHREISADLEKRGKVTREKRERKRRKSKKGKVEN